MGLFGSLCMITSGFCGNHMVSLLGLISSCIISHEPIVIILRHIIHEHQSALKWVASEWVGCQCGVWKKFQKGPDTGVYHTGSDSNRIYFAHVLIETKGEVGKIAKVRGEFDCLQSESIATLLAQ